MAEDHTKSPPPPPKNTHTLTHKLPWSRPVITVLDELSETSGGGFSGLIEDAAVYYQSDPTS